MIYRNSQLQHRRQCTYWRNVLLVDDLLMSMVQQDQENKYTNNFHHDASNRNNHRIHDRFVRIQSIAMLYRPKFDVKVHVIDHLHLKHREELNS